MQEHLLNIYLKIEYFTNKAKLTQKALSITLPLSLPHRGEGTIR